MGVTVLRDLDLGFWRLCQVLRKALWEGLLRLACVWPWLAIAGSYLFTASGRVQCPPALWEHHGVLYGPAALWARIHPAAHARALTCLYRGAGEALKLL